MKIPASWLRASCCWRSTRCGLATCQSSSPSSSSEKLAQALANFKLDHLPSNLANNSFIGGDTKSKYFLFNLHSTTSPRPTKVSGWKFTHHGWRSNHWWKSNHWLVFHPAPSWNSDHLYHRCYLNLNLKI